MADRADITPELLRQLLDYDCKTGKFHWRKRDVSFFSASRHCDGWNTKYAGRETMTSVNAYGYLSTKIFSEHVLSHRAAWAYHYGEWPKGQIDHINGERSDNRILNLRDVHRNENAKNRREYACNKSGATGVCWHKRHKKWRAAIGAEGRKIYLGVFDDISDAIAARKSAERRYGYHENHGKAKT